MTVESGPEQGAHLLEIIEQEFEKALDMARKTRAGEVSGYSNAFDTGHQWINHAHELLKMRARIRGETTPEAAQKYIDELKYELAAVRAEFSELFKIAMENGREGTALLAEAVKKRDVEAVAS